MSGLSKTFRVAVLGMAVLAGTVACNRQPAPDQRVAAERPAAPTMLMSVLKAEDPSITPADPNLKGFFLVYSEVNKRADLNYDLNLKAEDGKAVSTVVIKYPMATIPEASPDDFPSMQRRNKALLDFMSVCLG